MPAARPHRRGHVDDIPFFGPGRELRPARGRLVFPLGLSRDGGHVVRAENLCHQAILMNHATGAVTPEDADVV